MNSNQNSNLQSIPVKLILALLVALLLYSQLPHAFASATEAPCYECQCSEHNDSDLDDIAFHGFEFSHNSNNVLQAHFYQSMLLSQRSLIPQQRAPPVF